MDEFPKRPIPREVLDVIEEFHGPITFANEVLRLRAEVERLRSGAAENREWAIQAEADMAAWREKYNDAVADRVAAEREVERLKESAEWWERNATQWREDCTKAWLQRDLSTAHCEAAERKLAKVLDEFSALADTFDDEMYSAIGDMIRAITKEARDE